MTDTEREIRRLISYIRSCGAAGIDCTVTIDKGLTHGVLNALTEIQQYRKIGTVEECREAVEKQEPKKVLSRKCDKCSKDCDGLCEDYTDRCPECKEPIQNEYGIEYAYCPECGQAIDWSEEVKVEVKVDEKA